MGSVLNREVAEALPFARQHTEFALQELESWLDAGPRDALFFAFSENQGVHFADDRPLYNQILDTEGFDHTTGCDTAFSDHHAGAMICAGFAMMEIDHEY